MDTRPFPVAQTIDRQGDSQVRNDLVVAQAMPVVPFEQQVTIANAFVRSGLFGVKNVDQALSLMAICEAEGLHPAKAVQEYHVIQGRPALKADAMLARFQRAGGKVSWTTYTDECVSGTFSHQAGGSVEIKWTIEQARKIKLTDKDNWKNYPRSMLRSRCISEGVRSVYPGIATGMYTVDEVQDMAPSQPQGATRVESTVTLPSIDDGDLAALSDDLRSSINLEALQEKWKALTREQRQALAETKEQVKEALIAADVASMQEAEK